MDENPNQADYGDRGMTPTVMRFDAHAQVEHNMTNHAPAGPHVVAEFERLRRVAKVFAHEILDTCPDTRERSMTLTKAEESLMWAVAAIARNQ